MPEEETHKTWLDEFRKEVDGLLEGSPAAAPDAGRESRADFAAWWKSEQESLDEPRPQAEVQAAARDQPMDPGRELAARIEKLSREKDEAEAKLSRAAQDLAILRRRQGDFPAMTAELETKLSRARESYESAIVRLETQVRRLEEQLQPLLQDKACAEKARAQLEARNQRLEQDLRLALEKAAAAQAERLEARRCLGAAEAELRRLEIADAAAQATIAELRRRERPAGEEAPAA